MATVTITVYSIPQANDDYYEVVENQELDITAPGVLGNDTNADGNPLTAVMNSLPSMARCCTSRAMDPSAICRIPTIMAWTVSPIMT